MSNAVSFASTEPQWFIALFGVVWLAATGALAHASGWARLAKVFASAEAEAGKRFRFVAVSMGTKSFPVSYGSSVFVSVSEAGIHLSILVLFRFMSPPLFLPWAQVESVTEKRTLFKRYAVICMRDQWPVILVRGRAGQFIMEAFDRESAKQAASQEAR